jgi:putative ABC transport system ATP-binding protein
MIFQSFELLEYLDLRDNVLLQARLAPGIAVTDKLVQRALAITSELGLGDKWRRPITALSQGERQRVAACRALLLDPPLVLADEPTGNLDPDNKQAVLDHLIDLCSRDQRMLLTVTHDHSLLPAFDRVVDMAELAAQSGTVA